jgi:proteasome beta subunit
MHAGTVVKVGWKRDLTADEAIELACRSLWEAAEADSATGGPDVLRVVYPIMATITSDGWVKSNDDALGDIFARIAQEVRAR